MYAPFFGLRQEPFSIAPDPRYLFMSERHREALAHLLYGVKGGGGFVLLTGEIGAGKTTVCRCFLEQIPKRCNVAYIFNPKLTVEELLKTICHEFGIPAPHEGPGVATVKDYVDALNEFLLKTHSVGQNNVLIIDEAQNLSADVLEQLRLLTNLETSERKLLQIVLIGQPELRAMLARPELEQLAQRVVARFHLEALSPDETAQYIRHRLSVAGMKRSIPFDRQAMQRIHALSRGVPRRINLLCDRALLGAYAVGKPQVDNSIVDKAAGEVFDKPPSMAAARFARPGWVGLAAGAVLVGAVGIAVDRGAREAPPAAQAVLPAASAAAPLAVAASAPRPAASAPLAIAPADLALRFATLTRDEKDAWRELAAAWKLTLADGDPCQQAMRQQVHCFRTPASTLAQIRQLGRPGIVTLHDDADKPVYALLTGLGSDSARLRMNGVTQTVSLASLATMWRGNFSTLWRAPAGYSDKVAGEPTGAAAVWLGDRLVQLHPAAASAPLRARIQAFQLAQGLKADGLPGPMTFMQLNRAVGIDEPRLQIEG